MKFKAIGRALAGAALAASVAIPVAAPQATAAGTVHGCPYGAVCLYTGPNWDKIQNVYWSYGTHTIENYYGWHRVFNNQSSGAKATVCIDVGGVYCGGTFYQGGVYDVYMEPFNSVKLWARDAPGTR